MSTNSTNIDFVIDLMKFSEYGALAQVFVIEALSHHAHRVAKADPKDVDTPYISGAAWVGLAQEIKAKLDERYKRVA